MSQQDRFSHVERLAKQMGLLDDAAAEARQKIADALRSIADPDSPLDTGIGQDGMDFWLVIDGREYYLNARLSNQEKARGK